MMLLTGMIRNHTDAAEAVYDGNVDGRDLASGSVLWFVCSIILHSYFIITTITMRKATTIIIGNERKWNINLNWYYSYLDLHHR